MSPRHPPLQPPAIGFAHRGARAHARDNTLEGFRLALRLGATGLESDVWCTADGEAVLVHDGVVRRGLVPRRIRSLRREQLPAHVPTLRELYDEVGGALPLSLDVKDPAALAPTLAAAEQAGAVEALWLCHPDLDLLVGWRQDVGAARLVHSTRLRRLPHGPERHAATLAEEGIEAVNLHHSDWTGGLTTLYHRFGRLALGWDAQHERILDELLDIGIDGLFSDHVDRMVDALARAYGGARRPDAPG